MSTYYYRGITTKITQNYQLDNNEWILTTDNEMAPDIKVLHKGVDISAKATGVIILENGN